MLPESSKQQARPWTLPSPPVPRGPSPASPVEKTLLDTVTLSSGTLAQSPVARQPFMGKLMSVAPLAGSLWMLRTGAGAGAGAGGEGGPGVPGQGTPWSPLLLVSFAHSPLQKEVAVCKPHLGARVCAPPAGAGSTEVTCNCVIVHTGAFSPHPSFVSKLTLEETTLGPS